MYGALDVGTSALVAYRTNLDVIAGNIAMKDAVRLENGEAVPEGATVADVTYGKGVFWQRIDAKRYNVHRSAQFRIISRNTQFKNILAIRSLIQYSYDRILCLRYNLIF